MAKFSISKSRTKLVRALIGYDKVHEIIVYSKL